MSAIPGKREIIITNDNKGPGPPSGCGRRAIATQALLLLDTPVSAPDVHGARPTSRLPAQDSFTDQLPAIDATRRIKADGWRNGPPFANGWLSDHTTFDADLMDIRL
jgi:hypothetical protein